LQPHGPAELAASVGVWIAAVRLPTLPGVIAGGVITGALALTIVLSQHPAVQPALDAVLLCLPPGVTGPVIRPGRESQDRTEARGGQGMAARGDGAGRAGGTARAGPTAGGWLVELEVPG